MKTRTAWGLALLAALLPSSHVAAQQEASGYAVVVDYTVDNAHFDALKALVLRVARASIAEPGCRRFDVVLQANIPDHLTLYEVFDSKAAFDAHTATPHFKSFAADSGAIQATRTASPGAVVLSLSH